MQILKCLFLLPGLLFLVSCEKVIDVNVKNSQASVVIVGEVSNALGPYQVRVTQTVPLQENIPNPGLAALVYVTELGGTTDTFRALGNGLYESNTLQGKIGKTYVLHVLVDGQQYQASSTIPSPVPFDSLSFIGEVFFKDSSFYPQVNCQDPPGVANYYRFVEYINGKQVKANFVRDDRFWDGKYGEIVLRNFGDDDLAKGDQVRVDMQCLDKAAFDYFNTLDNAGGSSNSAAPANPITNISGGALGYFSAHTSQVKTATR